MPIDYVYDFHKNHELMLEKERYLKRGLCGLVNLGNKCFLNSIIQCLSNTLKLTDFFLTNKHIDEQCDQPKRRSDEFFLVVSYVNLLSNIWEANQLIKPKSFVENLSRRVKKYFTLQQQDSHECLLFLLDILHNGLSYEIDVEIKGEVKDRTDQLMKKSLESWKSFYESNYSFIIECFNGLTYSEISCKHCKATDNLFEPYNCLSVDVPLSSDRIELTSCLDTLFASNETIESWHCEKCEKTGCNKANKVWTLPNYLIIHLKRFKNDGSKNHTEINFPLEDLNLTKYLSNDKNDPNNYIFSLYAVNYHSGSTDSGHYWSCCRNIDGNWYLFNDGHVSRYHNVVDVVTKDAYILFYYRKYIKNPVLV